jgi:hypothetical protein
MFRNRVLRSVSAPMRKEGSNRRVEDIKNEIKKIYSL